MTSSLGGDRTFYGQLDGAYRDAQNSLGRVQPVWAEGPEADSLSVTSMLSHREAVEAWIGSHFDVISNE